MSGAKKCGKKVSRHTICFQKSHDFVFDKRGFYELFSDLKGFS